MINSCVRDLKWLSEFSCAQVELELRHLEGDILYAPGPIGTSMQALQVTDRNNTNLWGADGSTFILQRQQNG